MKKVVLWCVAAGALGMALVIAGAAIHAYRVAESFQFWESPAPAPLKAFHYSRDEKGLQDFIVMTQPGTKLSDVADMSVFGSVVPGQPPEAFATRYGASSVSVRGYRVKAAIDRASSGSSVSEQRVVYAEPIAGSPPIPVEAIVHPEIAARVRRAHFHGEIYIHNGASTGFLSVWVSASGQVQQLRWVGAA